MSFWLLIYVVNGIHVMSVDSEIECYRSAEVIVEQFPSAVTKCVNVITPE